MQTRSLYGSLAGIGSWALEVSGTSRIVLLSAYQARSRPTLAEQTEDVLARFDEMLTSGTVARKNVIFYDIVCDPSVTDAEFFDVVMPMLSTYFAECGDAKPAVGPARFARLLGGALIEITMVAAD